NAQGLGGIEFATGGRITVEAPLSVAVGGSVALIAPFVDIKADITARSGSITATNHLVIWSGPQALTSAGIWTITLGAGATLDARGLWMNALRDPADARSQAFIDGGDVRLVSSGDVVVAAGSVIDVSSGAGVLANGRALGGRGGNVTLKASVTE